MGNGCLFGGAALTAGPPGPKRHQSSVQHLQPLTACHCLPHPPGLMFPAALQLRQQQQSPLRPSLSKTNSPPPPPKSAFRTYVSGAPRGPATHPLKVWPFVLILLAGTGSYMFMVKSRVSDTSDKKKARGPSITPR